MSHDQLTPAPASQASVSGQSHDQNEIPVKCGPIEGSLHLDNLGGGQSGREGSVKCIYCSSLSKWQHRLNLKVLVVNPSQENGSNPLKQTIMFLSVCICLLWDLMLVDLTLTLMLLYPLP